MPSKARRYFITGKTRLNPRARYKADPEKKKASVRDSYKADPEKKKASRYQEDLEENRAAKRQRYQEDVEENRAVKRQKDEDNSAAIKRHLKGIGIGMTPLSDWLNVLPRGSGIAGVTELPLPPKVLCDLSTRLFALIEIVEIRPYAQKF
ncbi:hypothetical protein EMCRGX_G003704 [Ephydatia muelleri]